MAAKIGILGESTVVASGTITVYTVPSDKSARIRILFMLEGSSDTSRYGIIIGKPGTETDIRRNTTANVDVWSGSDAIATPDPATSLLSNVNGVQLAVGGLGNMDSPNDAVEVYVSPLAADYFLSTGDTVRFNIDVNAETDHILQVIGVEDDA